MVVGVKVWMLYVRWGEDMLGVWEGVEVVGCVSPLGSMWCVVGPYFFFLEKA